MKKTIIILGGNSLKNVKWIENIKKELENEYDVVLLKYNNWVNNKGDLDIEVEIEKLKKICSNYNNYIIVAKSIGILLSLIGIERKVINPEILIAMGVPLDFLKNYNYDLEDLFLKTSYTTKILVIQQKKDYQGSFIDVSKILPSSIPLIPINGSDHAYNNLFLLKKYIDSFIKLNSTTYICEDVDANSFEEAIKYIDNNRKKYKFYNNWLSDGENKILYFKYKTIGYIAKRVNYKKAKIELENAKMLNQLFTQEKINLKYNYIIETPYYYKINSKYGYLVSKYYGLDLNQLFYSNYDQNNKDIYSIFKEMYNFFRIHKIRYNGFLPRNIIIDNKKVYLIDFEDINRKSNIAVETNIKIGWSYFIEDINLNIESPLEYNDTFSSKFILSNNYKKYKNPYYIALKAEANQMFKMDDIINTLSKYISLDTEIFLDVILYEQNNNENKKELQGMLYSISQYIRLIECFKSNSEVKKEVQKLIYKLLY